MKRNVTLEEISDGRLYGANDMVKADCHGCKGCSKCCHGMGNSIILDPFDVYRLTKGLQKEVAELIGTALELNVVDGIILPNLKMDDKTDACTFLDENGRCSIHAYRTGICRMFPLGRFYEDNSFKYFLQIHECPKSNKTKVKIKKWLDTPDLKTYEQFICDWHYFLKGLQERAMENPDLVKDLSMIILKLFYMTAYSEEDFYKQFYRRLSMAKNKTK